MPTSIRNQLGAVRRARGVSAAELARRVGVSRQTIHAIEAGSYIPNTEVTLKLGRELEVSVEELFTLEAEDVPAPDAIDSEVLSAVPAAKGQAVRVCRVGERLVSIPVQSAPYYLPEADGVISRVGRAPGHAELAVFAPEDPQQKKLTLAGCDPAIGLVSSMVEKLSGVELISAAASSRLALTWLKEGKVHIAGSHLEDPATGEFNLPFLRLEFPDDDLAVVTFARWEEGFVTAPGNPLGIRSAGDLAGAAVRFVNREKGSGSRGLLDRLLAEAGVPPRKVVGYDRVAYGHLAAAYAVLAGEADCCLATRSAAQAFGLDFVALRSERYDFVMRRQTLEMPAVQGFLDVLQRAALRRKLETLAGYDTAQTGSVQA
ncbi:substrate-binding domain-containing protein [Paludibaculum fermentans]|uniref:Helix-turn-helix domain-containing protein n=1 Tax=Paludibaculum fermentans TaxID=1473598 RepID=A0A7S7NWZ0_PALFE|nr:substrate-binding domain-containing protein [Paludibaculum fermentans]QOY91336.1 helix-turn-helix domain-containing protein [Paludibaculum fermentans]